MVFSYIRTAVLYCFFFVSAIETLIVVACHVLFVTTVLISENELRESINIIIMMLISAHVLRYHAYHHPLAIQLFLGRNVGVMRTTTH